MLYIRDGTKKIKKGKAINYSINNTQPIAVLYTENQGINNITLSSNRLAWGYTG